MRTGEPAMEQESRRATETFAVQQYVAAQEKDQATRDHAWAQLQQVFEPVVRSRVMAATRGQMDEGMIDNMVQEVFISAFTSFDHFDPSRPEAFGGYLRTIVDRRLVDASRKIHGRKGRTAYTPWSRETPLEEFRDEKGELPNFNGSDATPESLMMEAEKMQPILEALQGLNERQRRIVIMRNMLGLKLKEIGTILGISESAASIALTSITKTIRERMGRKGRTAMTQDEFDGLVAEVRSEVEKVLGKEALQEEDEAQAAK